MYLAPLGQEGPLGQTLSPWNEVKENRGSSRRAKAGAVGTQRQVRYSGWVRKPTQRWWPLSREDGEGGYLQTYTGTPQSASKTTAPWTSRLLRPGRGRSADGLRGSVTSETRFGEQDSQKWGWLGAAETCMAGPPTGKWKAEAYQALLCHQDGSHHCQPAAGALAAPPYVSVPGNRARIQSIPVVLGPESQDSACGLARGP